MSKESIKAWRTQFANEKNSLKQMRLDSANVPKGWSVEKQTGFVKGMAHAIQVLKYPENYIG